MNSGKKAVIVSVVLAWGSIGAVSALADPLPGEVLKFQQLPMDGTVIPTAGAVGVYYGHDELSTARLVPSTGAYTGMFMADDFADKFATPVVHVRWWGSYLNGTVGNGVPQFLVAFESDVPAVPGASPSHPGQVLLSETVVRGPLAPGSGTFTEVLKSPGGAPLNEALYEYNAELLCPFPQKPDTVYWLKIVALVDAAADGPIQWGWHNRDYTAFDPLASSSPSVVPGERDQQPLDPGYPTSVWHFQDDAFSGDLVVKGPLDPTQPVCNISLDQGLIGPEYYVDGLDGPGPVPNLNGGIGRFSKDLAFELYTIPEPVTMMLLAAGAVALIRRRR